MEAFTLLKYIAEGNPFSIFLQNGKKYPGGINSNIKKSRGIEQYFNYFKMLSEIEKYYQVRFISIDEITDDTFQLVRLLYAISCNSEMQLDFTSYLEGKFDAEAITNLKERNGEPINDLTIVFDTYRIFVHDQIFTFKHRTLRINDAEVVNLDAVLNGETDMLRITTYFKRGD
ncbi:hypothetical protein CJD36_020185 [Flavipsychrobacter stenotrophus]|uniref:Uncharacterized protein n=1 Tax=Flavipsychrobacter stenotrophus TaxID=2077091 RepID=A0A2S7SQE0_9BACT|nr:hypothetical protein [Flavipsychrobacter stenotrophus]PQJ09119.1 hypothetical protein CJD36_020185 [Flavipsychrobacter stenotrophus]